MPNAERRKRKIQNSPASKLLKKFARISFCPEPDPVDPGVPGVCSAPRCGDVPAEPVPRSLMLEKVGAEPRLGEKAGEVVRFDWVEFCSACKRM